MIRFLLSHVRLSQEVDTEQAEGIPDIHGNFSSRFRSSIRKKFQNVETCPAIGIER
jgi:hypothetical protein